MALGDQQPEGPAVAPHLPFHMSSEAKDYPMNAHLDTMDLTSDSLHSHKMLTSCCTESCCACFHLVVYMSHLAFGVHTNTDPGFTITCTDEQALM